MYLIALSEFSALIKDRSVKKAWSKIPPREFKHIISQSWVTYSYTHVNSDVRVFVEVSGLIHVSYING